jgi:hypothetical protein
MQFKLANTDVCNGILDAMDWEARELEAEALIILVHAWSFCTSTCETVEGHCSRKSSSLETSGYY